MRAIAVVSGMLGGEWSGGEAEWWNVERPVGEAEWLSVERPVGERSAEERFEGG